MLDKIKNLFYKIFKKQKLLNEINEEGNKDEEIETLKESFKKQINVDMELYNLQKKYELGKITEDDMQIKQIKELIHLYRLQLEKN